MTLSPTLLLQLSLPPLFWAGNAVVGRMTVPHVPPLLLNASRWVLVLIVLLVLGRGFLASGEQRANIRRRWVYLSAIGLTGIGAYNALQYLALTTSTPLNVTLIAASMPLWMLGVGGLFYGQRPQRPQLMGAALSLAGVVTVLTRGHVTDIVHMHFVQGDLFMLAAAASWAVYSWMLAMPPAHMRDAQRPTVRQDNGERRPWNWHEFMLAQALFGVVWAGASAGVEAALIERSPDFTPWVGLALLYIVIGPSLIAYWFWGQAVKAAGPTLASLFANLTPLFAALLSGAILGEVPQAYHAIAFVLIVTGIAVSSRR